LTTTRATTTLTEVASDKLQTNICTVLLVLWTGT